MGIKVGIADKLYQVESYTIQEDSTPTSSNDSSGSVGTINFNLKGVEEPLLLYGEEVFLVDSRRGATVGYVTGVVENDHGTAQISCLSRMGRLNVYGVQSQPFVGTIGEAVEYYVDLSGQQWGVLLDPELSDEVLALPGWHGELWYYLKLLASSNGVEIALVGSVLVVRPLRQREASDERNTARSRTYGDTNFAKSVEVVVYNNRPIQRESVYPPGGWTMETEVISVGAGEEIERVLELSASVDYIVPPVMQTFVAQNFNSSSVYTVVGDDGFPIQPAQWRDAGGRVELEINEDTTSLTLRFKGAEGIINAKGEPISTYSLALASDTTGNRYSTLRLIGNGVAFNKETIKVRTIVPDQLTGTEVGVTIDSPFISTYNQAYNAGVKAAKQYAGENLALSGSVTSLSGAITPTVMRSPYPSFDNFPSLENFPDSGGGVSSSAEEQLGNIGGSRVWDRKSRRWFRIREASVTTSEIGFQADDDLIYGDVVDFYSGWDYGRVTDTFEGDSYSRRIRRGLFKGRTDGLIGNYPSHGNFPSPINFPAKGD